MFKTLFQRSASTQVATDIEEISGAELKARLDSGEPILLLDVRSAAEYQQDGHIPGARLLPLNALPGRLHELPADQPIVCICRSGNRSKFACEALADAGFENVMNLQGGMFGWQMAGYPSR